MSRARGGTRPRRRALAGLLAALAAALPGAARPAAAPARMDLALTISGGVSLGSYEAGFLSYALEVARRNPGRFGFPLATGASAGSVNALLSALAACGEPAPSPRQSLFWQVWTSAGFDRLFRPGETGRQGIFSRRWLGETADRLERALARGLPESCQVVLGVAVTRLNPRLVRAGGGAVEALRTEEKFVLRLSGRGPGRMPRFANFVDTRHAGEQLLLAERPDGEVDFATVRDLLLASSAFPLAFPPQPLAYCVVPGGAGPRACPAEAARTDLFLDGGFFDNQPLRLATSVAAAGLRDDPAGGTRWLPEPDRSRARLPEHLAFVFLSPEAVDFPGEPRREPVGADAGALELIGQVAGSFVRTARSKELYVLLEERPEIAGRIVAPVRHLPAASEPLHAFLGFFETAFRNFDFTLGMYEARRLATGGPGAAPALLGWTAPPALPEEAAAGSPAEAEWRPLACLRGVLDGDAAAAASCAGDDLADFRILLQVSLERLWDRCQAPAGEGHPSCRAAAAGAPVPAVPGLAASPGWRRRAGEGDVEYVVRLLADHRFRWRDLGLDGDHGGEALRVVRRRLGEAGAALAAAQPPGERLVVGQAARLAANALLYLPPRASWWVAVGGALELGAELGLGDVSGPLGWLRLHAALDVQGLSYLASSEPNAFALTPLVGLSAMPPGLSGAVLQWSAFARVGYLFAQRDSWGTAGCSDQDARRLGACSRAAFQVGVAATFIDLVRLQLAGELYPPLRSGLTTLWAVSPTIGVQFRF